MPNYADANTIIGQAAQELGLGAVTVTATDATGFQMLGLLNALCDEIYRVHDWENLERVMNFQGAYVVPPTIPPSLETRFPLPTDFGRPINQTAWAVNNTRAMSGPVNAPVWSWLQYGVVSNTLLFQYRLLDGVYQLYPAPGVGEQFALYYISKNWNYDAYAEPDPVYNSRITKNTDVPQFDWRMLVAGLKVKLWAQKGFDTTTLTTEFQYLLQAEKGQLQGAPVINLSNNYGGAGLIGWGNCPEGTFNGGLNT
jgi:hypothetical protein